MKHITKEQQAMGILLIIFSIVLTHFFHFGLPRETGSGLPVRFGVVRMGAAPWALQPHQHTNHERDNERIQTAHRPHPAATLRARGAAAANEHAQEVFVVQNMTAQGFLFHIVLVDEPTFPPSPLNLLAL
jgi:hypothetical protein